MKRRTFIQNTSLAAAGAMLAPSMLGCASQPNQKPIGIQLYTLRDVIGSDVKGTLKKVADIGFKELETYSHANGKIFDLPFAEFGNMAKDMGLSIISGHYGTGQSMPDVKGTLVNGWESAVEDAKRAGQKYMVIAYLAQEERTSLDDYKRICARMNQASEICKSAGITFGYHNHEFEFIPLEGRVPYEVMTEELDPSVILELDIYWSTFANVDALELFKKYAQRIQLWHVKDMSKEKREQQTDVGSGTIDYKTVFANAELSGMKHFFLEQEYFTGSQFDSITKGYKHLRSFV